MSRLPTLLSRMLVLLVAFHLSPAEAEFTATQIRPAQSGVADGGVHLGVRLLGSLALSGDEALAELSGLAWDDRRQILYAISDRGLLLHLQPVFRDGWLVDARLLASMPLRDRDGAPLRGKSADSEGLVLAADGESLLVSFERRHRIDRYDFRGNWLANLPLPPPLNQSERFRKPNRGIEGFTWNTRFGLIAAAEGLLRGDEQPRLASGDGSWFYRPNRPGGRLVAIESEPGGSLLLLERAFSSPFEPWTLSLLRVRPSLNNQGQTLPIEVLAEFDSGKGWLLQNLEGMSRHQGRRYFLVSDNNGQPWSQTQLIYLELTK